MKLLRSLGYRASLKVLGRTAYFAVADDPRTKAQIGFLPMDLRLSRAVRLLRRHPHLRVVRARSPANTNAAEFCDPRIDRQIEKALAEQATNPHAARRLWERIDRQTVDQAPWVPLVNPKISRRSLEARRQLPVQPDVADADRPALGSLRRIRPEPHPTAVCPHEHLERG